MATRRHPLDFEALKKGDVISIADLEEILGTDRGNERFPLLRLGLQSRIETEMRDRGTPVTVATRKGSLRILTDSEAAEHNPRSRDIGFRRMCKAHFRALEVDVENLGEDERKALEHEIDLGGRMIAAAQEARRLPVLPNRRTVPGLSEQRSSSSS